MRCTRLFHPIEKNRNLYFLESNIKVFYNEPEKNLQELTRTFYGPSNKISVGYAQKF